MENRNLNSAQMSPAVIDFKKFNEMMGRRGMGTENVSVMNPATSTEGMTNPAVKQDGEKLREATAGAVGPFTVKIKHEDGYEDEVTSDNHELALQKAGLTVADNYAPDLVDSTKTHINDHETRTQAAIEARTKHLDFEKSLRPQALALLDEHAKNWPKRRAELIDVINKHTGLKLGPQDNLETPEVDRSVAQLRINSHVHPVYEAYHEITGKAPAILDHYGNIVSGGGRSLYLIKRGERRYVSGGDILSGRRQSYDYNIAIEKDEKNPGHFIDSFGNRMSEQNKKYYDDFAANYHADSKEWHDSLTKGVYYDKNRTKDDALDLLKMKNPELLFRYFKPSS